MIVDMTPLRFNKRQFVCGLILFLTNPSRICLPAANTQITSSPEASMLQTTPTCSGKPAPYMVLNNDHRCVHDFYTNIFHGSLCGEGTCYCLGSAAQCPKHLQIFGYIPKLPPKIRIVRFQGNSLEAVDENFFTNVSRNILLLDMRSNGICEIGMKAFLNMSSLKSLILKDNNFPNYSALAAVLTIDSLKSLDLSHNMLGAPPREFFDGRLPRLKNLDLSSNHIHYLDMEVFVPLKKLSCLDLSDNQLTTEYLLPAYLPLLSKFLNLEFNALKTIPDTCDENDKSFFPHLKRLSLRANRITTLKFDQVCFPELADLDCSENPVEVIRNGTFDQSMFPSLRRLDISNMLLERIENSAFVSHLLSYINLKRNFLDFDLYSFHPNAFQSCPNLSSLILDHNNLGNVENGTISFFIRYSTKLVLLRIVSSYLTYVNAAMFEPLVSLRILFLSNNKLTYIPDGTFDNLPCLEELYLDQNQLSVIKETTFGMHVRSGLRICELGYNAFTCDCDLRWLQGWLLTRDSSSLHDFERYGCRNLPESTVLSFHVDDQACLLSHEASRFIITIVSTVLLTLTLLILVYRYRWHIRLVLYEAFRGREDRRRRLQEQHFDYDVFVSFDSDDFPWVRQHLMPTLEDGLGLRLCIHERDFRPGKHIVENISHCVQASKKVMMLFSQSFAASPWCQFELNMCLSHVMENDDTLLVVFLHDIPSRDMTPAMMAVMKTTTYIGWGDGPEARASFWGRVRLALDEVMPETV